MTKRIISIITVIALAVLSAACSGNAPSAHTSGKVYALQNFDGSTGEGIFPPEANSQGELVVASQTDGAPLKLTTYDASGKKKAEVATDVTDAVREFALDGKGTAYAVTQPDAAVTVQILGSDGKTARIVTINDLPKPGEEEPVKGKGVGLEGFAASSDGSLFLVAMGKVLQYDSAGKQVRAYDQDGMNFIAMNEKEQLIVCSIGKEMPTLTIYDTKSGSEVSKVNAPLANPQRIIYDTKGKRVLYMNEQGVYPVKADGSTGDALVKFTEFNLSDPSRNTTGFVMDGEGSIYISSVKVDSIDNAGRIDKLALVDAASLPQRKVIAIAGIVENNLLNDAISAYQTAHPEYKIEIKSYQTQLIGMKQSQQQIDLTSLIQQFSTDVLAGNSADIYILDDLPYYKYIDKGMLADIGQMMTDSGMDMSQYYANIFDACKVNGKLYTLPIGFSYNLLVGKTANMPATGTPTMDEFIQLANSLPAGTAAFPAGDDKLRVFSDFMLENYSYFIDQSTHTARFNSPEFVKVLNDFKALPDSRTSSGTPEGQDGYEQVGNGSLAFSTARLRRVDELSTAKAFIGEDMKFTSMPTMQSGVNNFEVRGMFGINASSPNKQTAWEFLQTLLTTQMQSSQRLDGFPVNKQATANKINLLKSVDTMGKNGGRLIIGGTDKEIEVKPLSDQEYDAIAEHFGKLNMLWVDDANIAKILDEELPTFFSGQKSAQEVADLIQNRVQTILGE